MFFLIESVREKLKKVQLQEVLNKAFKKRSRGLPGGSLVKNPPANAGDTGSIPDLGRSHMPRSNKARLSQLNLCSRAQELHLRSPHAAATEALAL